MGKVNISVLLNKYGIMLCMWGHVLLHRMDQMPYDQDLNLVHNVYCRELDSCNDMGRIGTYLYFNKFSINWCSFFCKSRKFIVCSQIFESCVDFNLTVLKMHPYKWFWKGFYIILKISFAPFTRPYDVIWFPTHNSINIFHLLNNS